MTARILHRVPWAPEVTMQQEFSLSYSGLRTTIGLIGLLMPWFVRLGGYLREDITVHGTVSAYYYTSMRDVFVGTLVLVGVLLACYRTRRPIDNYIAVLAGLAAICIGLLPTYPILPQSIIDRYRIEDIGVYLSSIYFPHGPVGFHFPAVVVFFSLAFYLVLISFRSTAKAQAEGRAYPTTWEKDLRNKLYLYSAVAMLLGGVAIAAFVLADRLDPDRQWGQYIFFPESLAISAFAFAWLIKGQVILRDGVPAHRQGTEIAKLIGLLSLPITLFLIGWYLTAMAEAPSLPGAV